MRTLEVEIIKKVKLDDLLERTAQKLAEKGDAALVMLPILSGTNE